MIYSGIPKIQVLPAITGLFKIAYQRGREFVGPKADSEDWREPMIEFPLHSLETAPPSSRALLADAVAAHGRLPNMARTMAESPAALQGFELLRQAFAQSSLTPLEQQVVYLTVSKVNACHYCTTQTGMFDDSPAARAAADAIREDRPIADTKLQALRRFAAAMTEERGWVSEGLIDRFISAGYGRAQVLEVISGIALATMSSYTNHVAATPIEGKAGWAALDG